MMNMRLILILLMGVYLSPLSAQLFDDVTKNYTLPTFTKNKDGKPVLYWTEKDDKNVTSICYATSLDGGITYTDKKVAVSGAGVGSSKLARPKLLFKKDGSIVTIFTFRKSPLPPPPPPKQIAQASENMDHSNMKMDHGNMKMDNGTAKMDHSTPEKKDQAPRPKRESQIAYVISKDNGDNWTSIANVDSDTSALVRGFFDAVLLANDEIAVSYLKDVKGSTKHEERDLRLVVSKNGQFQPERLIDAVVCDCCNISMSTEESGKLNIYYRDNNDDIRDIAVMSSSDNAKTFTPSKIIHNDRWKIQGCPHSGAASTPHYVTWFSGEELTSGIRLANSKGEFIAMRKNGKNHTVSSNGQAALWAWDEMVDSKSKIFYSFINGNSLSDSKSIGSADEQQNANFHIEGKKTIVAYEQVVNKKSKIIVTVLN
jgi:hypothetical protein